VLENHALDFDAFRGGYLARGAGSYAFVEAPNGHLTSVFPIGTSLLTFPIFASLYGLRLATAGPPPILRAAFEDERRRDEKIAAAIVAACAVVLCYFTARRFGTVLQAAVATVVFGFAGEMFTIGAQGLWQHGPVNLILLGAAFAVVRAAETVSRAERGWLALAGLCAGALPTIRPTAIVFTLAIVIFVTTRPRLRAVWPWFALGLLAGIAPSITWNAVFFRSLGGGYSADLYAYDLAPAHALGNLVGLLLSPSRGLLIFSPIVVFAALGLLRASRQSGPHALLVTLLGGAAALLLGNYALYSGWIGGHCFGPRFLTDISAVTALGLVFIVPPSLSAARSAARRHRAVAVVFFAVLVASILVQFVGSYSGAAGPVWNAIPIDVGRDPARVWALRDSQIERNLRATFYRYAPIYPTAGSAYAAGFAGAVLGVAGSYRAGRSALLAASVLNDGTSRWYGSDTAVYNGEARVHAKLTTPRGAVVSEGDLYLRGVVEPGTGSVAQGLFTFPAAPGAYTLHLAVYAFARDDVPAANRRPFSAPLQVR
jgi:hypothetical protein